MSAYCINLNDGSKYDIKSASISIGRDPSNNIQIHDDRVSSYHAKIIRREKGYYLEDTDSTNGTFFKGKKIKRVHLLHNDQFRIGKEKFQFYEPVASVLLPETEPPAVLTPDKDSHYPTEKENIFKKPAFVYGLSAIAGLILVLSLILFGPFYTVQTGERIICKHCNKDIINTIHTVSASLVTKDDYQTSTSYDYCTKCGNERVAYHVSLKCLNCGITYAQKILYAPRKEEKQDVSETAGYCSAACRFAGEAKGLLDKGSSILKGLINPFR